MRWCLCAPLLTSESFTSMFKRNPAGAQAALVTTMGPNGEGYSVTRLMESNGTECRKVTMITRMAIPG